MLSFYEYKNCSTCRKARKYLTQKGIAFTSFEIQKTPPSSDQLQRMAQSVEGGARKLFNTSGGIYREMGLKDKLSSMSEEDMIALLSTQGMLIKRPFLQNEQIGVVGFKEEEWNQLLN